MRARRMDPYRYTNPGIITQIVEQVRLTWRLLNDPRVPGALKMIIPALAVIYSVSPLDILPDFLIGLGQLDDIGVILAALALFIRLAPRSVVDEHRAAMAGSPGHAGWSDSERRGGEGWIDPKYTVRGERRDKSRAR